jgi:uncharacterized membrane protein YedE/YeeE
MHWLRQNRWSPYVVGALIGVLSWFTFAVAGKAIGVSTNFSQAVRLLEEAVVPTHAAANRYFNDYKIPSKIGWEVTILVGILLGAWVSSKLSGDRHEEKVPELWARRFGPSVTKRYLFAFLGGAILMFGARLAGGCTSGHGISGSLQLAVSSWSFFVAMFVSGLVTALAIYKTGKSHV